MTVQNPAPLDRLVAKFALNRPTPKQLARFKIEDIGADTVGAYTAVGDSLVICCRMCQRLTEWTPAELKDRFPDPAERVADIAQRLRCSGPDGCGEKDIAVFPHFNIKPKAPIELLQGEPGDGVGSLANGDDR